MGLGSDFTSSLATLDNKLIQTGGNFVYIVGPEVFFAEDMLRELQEQLIQLTDIQKLNEQTIPNLTKQIQELKNKPAERYNLIVTSIISAIVGGMVTFIINNVLKH
jgi:Sec-independent protein secretion pathway component TatC